jgi:hypothetical protein
MRFIGIGIVICVGNHLALIFVFSQGFPGSRQNFPDNVFDLEKSGDQEFLGGVIGPSSFWGERVQFLVSVDNYALRKITHVKF